jgi:hypothetical protein
MAIAMAMAIKATPVLHFLLHMLLNARFIKPIGAPSYEQDNWHDAIY